MTACEPATSEEKRYAAEPLASARSELTVVPSSKMVSVPVGMAATELDADATVMVMVSLSPVEGVVVAAASVVAEGTVEEFELGQAISKL